MQKKRSSSPPKGTKLRGGTSGSARLYKTVKTAKGRKLSSTLWLARQINDPYAQRARAEGYRSRAAYKLLEIQERYPLLGPGKRVVDLGAAPGGWCQVAAMKTAPRGGIVEVSSAPLVVAVDLLEMDPLPGVTTLQGDFLDPATLVLIHKALGGHQADLVLSDMAAPTTGHRNTDHLRSCLLAEAAAEFAAETLSPGGSFLCKVFRGGTQTDLLTRLKHDYHKVRHIKPPASRPESVEFYVLALGFRGSGSWIGTKS